MIPRPVARLAGGVVLPALAASVVTAIVAGAAAWALRPIRPHQSSRSSSSGCRRAQSFTGTSRQIVALSPDGTKVVYLANGRMYRPLDWRTRAAGVPGIESDPTMLSPVFAPDGDSIAFFMVAEQQNCV